MRFRCRAVSGPAGIDAASLGFGCRTKHPRCRQSPLSRVQHCAGDGVTGLPVERDSRPPSAGHRAAPRPYRVVAHRACPPCTSATRLLTSFKRPIGWPCNVVACASA
ncbi:hypothetical protein DIE03_29600 [Burkholderia sp. Bp8992]|nr:hypothetical protein DIE03_29600 [Burkholderia sp. Bp8992]